MTNVLYPSQGYINKRQQEQQQIITWPIAPLPLPLPTLDSTPSSSTVPSRYDLLACNTKCVRVCVCACVCGRECALNHFYVCAVKGLARKLAAAGIWFAGLSTIFGCWPGFNAYEIHSGGYHLIAERRCKTERVYDIQKGLGSGFRLWNWSSVLLRCD